ncbi:hypothetical protein ACFVWY_35510 [Streptomyces sp. NPDC058195]|uniref:hypothetical protein n=1 Tax=Streptomyces sp. NPDC058195 TaxID=3346375 RepID=UPI0036EEC44A
MVQGVGAGELVPGVRTALSPGLASVRGLFGFDVPWCEERLAAGGIGTDERGCFLAHSVVQVGADGARDGRKPGGDLVPGLGRPRPASRHFASALVVGGVCPAVEFLGQAVQSGIEGVLPVSEPSQERARGRELASSRVDAEEACGVTLCPARCLLDKEDRSETAYGLRFRVDLERCEMLLMPAFLQKGGNVLGTVAAGAVRDPGSVWSGAPV